jgi:hypothetical protein
MAKDTSIEPKDPVGKEIYNDIKSYTSEGDAVPNDIKQEFQKARKSNSFDPTTRPLLRNSKKGVRTQYR